MDPSVWGPKLWNVIYDICWMLDGLARPAKELTDAVDTFFVSLRFLLPCIYCRQSYQNFYHLLGPVTKRVSWSNIGSFSTGSSIRRQSAHAQLKTSLQRSGSSDHRGSSSSSSSGSGCLRWAYDLKNKVNAKLKRPGVLSFDCFRRRMLTWTSASSADDVVDVLSMFAANYSAVSTDVTKLQRRDWTARLLFALTVILQHMPGREELGMTMQTLAPSPKNLRSSNSLFEYLAIVANRSLGGQRSSASMKHKYLHCKSPKQPPKHVASPK